MALFLLMYFGLYGGMNAYVVRKLYLAFGNGSLRWLTGPGVAVALLVLLPIFMHHVEGRLPYGAIRCLAFVGYTWMALVFWFACVCLVLDLWNGGITCAGHWAPNLARLALAPRHMALGAAVPLTLAVVFGSVEARAVRLRTVEVTSSRLPSVARPLRVLLLADLHLGRTGCTEILAQAVARGREAAPDVILSCGDMVDAVDAPVDALAQQLATLQAPLGKFAVTGNHEFYPGIERTTRLHQIAGFTLVRNSVVQLTEHVQLIGVDDPAGAEIANEPEPDEGDIIPARKHEQLAILLKHRPKTTAAARARCDLQLSGHTHRGQVFPFGAFVRLLYPHRHGRLVTLKGGLRIYVSPGTGSWGPPLRLFARPEVTLFVIKPAT